uniref:Uncharacterized protein n=1 Tax=Cacopsylla melanoneura TaxID=428564 RepID=A0A8D8T8F9_9HEMI
MFHLQWKQETVTRPELGNIVMQYFQHRCGPAFMMFSFRQCLIAFFRLFLNKLRCNQMHVSELLRHTYHIWGQPFGEVDPNKYSSMFWQFRHMESLLSLVPST